MAKATVRLAIESGDDPSVPLIGSLLARAARPVPSGGLRIERMSLGRCQGMCSAASSARCFGSATPR